MTQEELQQLKTMIIKGDHRKLKEIFINHRDNCIHALMNKLFYSKQDAEDIYTDAFLVFRDNILSGKIEILTSVNGYLKSTCINMGKTKLTYDKKKLKKEEEIRSLFYENNHIISENKNYKQQLIQYTQQALKKLSEDCQKIIVAVYVYKIPMKEIAVEMGLASGDVAKMKKLRCYKSWIKKTKSLMQK